ncbi:MAG: signal recognition particle-docking protein FtsY [Acidobacteriota bacterium]
MSIFNYQQKRPGYFARLKDALKVTKEDLTHRMDELMGTADSPITEQQVDDLEDILISTDIGVETTLDITEKIREQTRGKSYLTSFQVKRMIREEILGILNNVDRVTPDTGTTRPQVVLVVGVNGTGKTTTIGKLAHLYKKDGFSVMISASDTFRAAAIEQLTTWADRTGSEIVKQSAGSDPAAVLFDAIAAAKARRKDVLIVDTAGRLHTKVNLMQELEKINRIATREVEGAPHEVFLVLDATTGQNGLVQAREFLKNTAITGTVVTKLDGTAKGGIVVAIAKELKIPIRYIGVGEKVEDLVEFSPEAFVDSLFTEKAAV